MFEYYDFRKTHAQYHLKLKEVAKLGSDSGRHFASQIKSNMELREISLAESKKTDITLKAYQNDQIP